VVYFDHFKDIELKGFIIMKQRKRNRKLGFDYTSEAIYFLTICTHNRICYFGIIENEQMILNKYGEIVENQILWLEQQYPYFHIHNHVVMPNHVHILCDISTPVGTGRDLSLRDTKIKSISELMGAFKTTSSKQIHLDGNTLPTEAIQENIYTQF